MLVARDAAGQVTLSVSDDGVDFGDACTSNGNLSSGSAANPGLGIGLTLVERIDSCQGAKLVRDGGAAPLGKRFARVWPSKVEQACVA